MIKKLKQSYVHTYFLALNKDLLIALNKIFKIRHFKYHGNTAIILL